MYGGVKVLLTSALDEELDVPVALPLERIPQIRIVYGTMWAPETL
jgi:hypothetical protein